VTCSNVNGASASAMATLGTVLPLPSTPVMTLSSPSITAGATATVSWSSNYAASCTASGSWSGTLAASGSQKLSPTSPGTYSYSLMCADVSGNSPASSVSLTVTASPPSGGGGGGGGAMGALSIVGLTLLAVVRRLRGSAGASG